MWRLPKPATNEPKRATLHSSLPENVDEARIAICDVSGLVPRAATPIIVALCQIAEDLERRVAELEEK